MAIVSIIGALCCILSMLGITSKLYDEESARYSGALAWFTLAILNLLVFIYYINK